MSTEPTGRSPSELTVPLPSGVSVRLDGRRIRVKGPSAELVREFPADALALTAAPGGVRLALKIPANRKRAKALLNTWERHLGNLVTGTTVGFEARLKSVAAHFPMKLLVRDGRLVIENFLGEKHPRSMAILPGVTASVEGEFVLLRGADIELVGRCAATIERTTRIRDYDPRVFQDGVYIVDRPHPREAS